MNNKKYWIEISTEQIINDYVAAKEMLEVLGLDSKKIIEFLKNAKRCENTFRHFYLNNEVIDVRHLYLDDSDITEALEAFKYE